MLGFINHGVKETPAEVAALKTSLEHDEEIEDINVVEAKRHLEKGKRRKMHSIVAVSTPQSSTSDDPLVGSIFSPSFMERLRVFSLICRNKWYERNLEPLPDFAEFADEFGRDAAFDFGNLFKTIRQAPHYGGLDSSKSEQFLDLWYILPQLFEALNISFSSQNFLERNKETIKDRFIKLAKAGFDISVPLAAFELLVIGPTKFNSFRESLDRASRQLSEERTNVEGLKSKLPVSEKIAGLVSKIGDVQQQIRDLESERMSLWQLKSVELEIEKYGTSMKAYRLKKQKELHVKELEEARQFLQDVSLGGWYEHIGQASQAK